MALKSTSPFARLFRPSSKAVDDDKVEDVVDDTADDVKDDLADPDAPDEDDTQEEAAAKRARRRAKKAKVKKAEGDDQSDEDDSMDAKASAARARERGRVAAIMGSSAAAANPNGALRLALRTSLTREAVIEALGDIDHQARQPDSARDTSAARSRLMGVNVPDVGNHDGAGQPNGVKATADAIVLAGKRRRGEA